MTLILAALGLACLVGGAMVMRLRTGSFFYVVWYMLGALLLLAALATARGWWSLLPPPLKNAGLVLLGLCAAVLIVTQCLVASQFNAQGEPDLDCIIVLGAQVHADGSPSTVLRHRLEAARDYLQANPNTRCIVSGGQGPNEPTSEAAGMAAWLVEHGIDSERITLEDNSTNTRQNIEYSKKLLDPEHDRIGIVTNNFHVFRSLGIARKAGLQHVCGIAAYTTPAYLPNNMLRETFGIVKDFATGNI